MGFTENQGEDGVTTVTVAGQLIVANRQELKQLIHQGIEQGRRKFLIDFTPTVYVDSSGLGALVSINKRLREAGGVLYLAGLNEDLVSLFALTRLDTLFRIFPTVAEAHSAF